MKVTCPPALRIHAFFAVHPMIIPFFRSGDNGIEAVLYQVLMYLLNTVNKMFVLYAAKGGFEGSWEAYQIELAFEEIFYGHPLSAADRQMSVAQGTCTNSENSLSHWWGFIGLNPYNSASVLEKPPPLINWTCNALQVERIMRIRPLCLALGQNPLS